MESLRSTDAGSVLQVRKEVQDFIEAAETLLSPALRNSDLTQDECDIIKDYVITMSNVKQPWSKELPVKYA